MTIQTESQTVVVVCPKLNSNIIARAGPRKDAAPCIRVRACMHLVIGRCWSGVGCMHELPFDRSLNLSKTRRLIATKEMCSRRQDDKALAAI